MPSLARVYSPDDVNTRSFGTGFAEPTFRLHRPAQLGPWRKTGEGGLDEEDGAAIPQNVRNLSVIVDQRDLKFRMKVVVEEYRNRDSFESVLASWAEDPAFVVPGKELSEAINELVSFLVATILDLRQTPDEQLTAEAIQQKRRFDLLVARG